MEEKVEQVEGDLLMVLNSKEYREELVNNLEFVRSRNKEVQHRKDYSQTLLKRQPLDFLVDKFKEFDCIESIFINWIVGEFIKILDKGNSNLSKSQRKVVKSYCDLALHKYLEKFKANQQEQAIEEVE